MSIVKCSRQLTHVRFQCVLLNNLSKLEKNKVLCLNLKILVWAIHYTQLFSVYKIFHRFYHSHENKDLISKLTAKLNSKTTQLFSLENHKNMNDKTHVIFSNNAKREFFFIIIIDKAEV